MTRRSDCLVCGGPVTDRDVDVSLTMRLSGPCADVHRHLQEVGRRTEVGPVEVRGVPYWAHPGPKVAAIFEAVTQLFPPGSPLAMTFIHEPACPFHGERTGGENPDVCTCPANTVTIRVARASRSAEPGGPR